MKKSGFSAGVLALALAGGFAGGTVSQKLFHTESVHADTFKPVNNELSASRFVLKDNHGATWGEFKVENQKPEIILYGQDGRPAWKATTDRLTLLHNAQ